jgi:enoyl-CoA hydratase
VVQVIVSELIRYERRGALALITLDRADKLNAINKAMVAQLHAVLDKSETDDGVRAIVVAGAGRAFSAGFDLDMESGNAPNATQIRTALHEDFRIIMRFWDCPKPTLAAVHGYCLGSAMELAMACDITVSSDDCRFGAPEVKFGSGIVAMLAPWLTGPKHAKYLLLSGDDRVTAQQAFEMGLINRVVASGHSLDETLDVAQRIAANDLNAVKLTKQAINRSLDLAGFREALLQSLELDCKIETSETAESRQFNEILKRDGAKAAIAWRSARASEQAGGTNNG